MYKKFVSTVLFASLLTCSAFAQKRPAITASDIRNLVGCWQGNLNYSGTMIRKPFATTAELVVKQIDKSNNFQFTHIYTKDPTENVLDTLTISRDGRKLNNAPVKSKRVASGKLEIMTELPGFDHDNNKRCVTRETYIISKSVYSYRKQVKLQGQDEWLDRQEFSYVNIPCATTSR